MSKYDTAVIEDAMKRIAHNVYMFEGYVKNPRATEYTKNQLTSMREQLVEVTALRDGTMEWSDLGHFSKEWFSTMPAWGTYGT